MKKKITALFLALTITFSMTLCVLAEDSAIIAPPSINCVALGDSVPAFYGLEESDGYVAKLSALLTEGGIGNSFVNLAVSGLDTQTLLAQLQSLQALQSFQSEDTLSALESADFITVNIGGNNILGPLVAIITKKFADMNVTDITALTPQILMSLVTTTFNDEEMALIQNGVDLFTEDFPQIIQAVKTAAPNAVIAVNTVYNPIPNTLAISAYSELVISAINGVISGGAETGGYAVADVYSAFKKAGYPVTNFSLTAGSVDIHPNAAGHQLIANEIAGEIQKLIQAVDIPEITEIKYLTRGEVVSQIISALSDFVPLEDPAGTENFIDVLPEHKDYNAILAAKANNIVIGTGDAKFQPDDVLTRQDFAVISVRIIKILVNAEILPSGLLQISVGANDIGMAADYAEKSIYTAAALNILPVSEDGEVYPLEGVTVEFLNALLALLK